MKYGKTFTVKLKEGGNFAFFCKEAIYKVLVNGQPVEIKPMVDHGQPGLYILDCENDGLPVEIDIHREVSGIKFCREQELS